METYKIRITFTEDCLGTASADPEIHKTFIASKAPDAPRLEEEVAALGADEVEEKAMTVFPKDETGNPFFWDYQIKGYMKDTCSALQRCKGEDFSKVSCGLKAYKKVIDKNVYVYPRRIPIHLPEGGKIGNKQRPLRAQTAQGERIALANSETVPAGSWIEIEVEALSAESAKAIPEWMDFGKRSGIGQWRNAGWGRFTWELIG